MYQITGVGSLSVQMYMYKMQKTIDICLCDTVVEVSHILAKNQYLKLCKNCN